MIKECAQILGLAMALASCAESSSTSSGRRGPDSMASRGTAAPGGALARAGAGGDSGRSMVSRGTDEYVDPEALARAGGSRTEVRVVDDTLVEMTLVNASIAAAAEAILGQTLGLTYLVAPDVTGQVTIQTTGPIPKSALLDLFAAALAASGARLEQQGEMVSVVQGSSGGSVFQGAGGPVSGGSIVVAPLEFISATEMAGLLEPLVAEGLEVVVDQNRNLLLLSGAPAQVNAAIDALNIFDVDALEGRSVALVPVTAADPEAVVEELQTIFEAREGGLLEGVIEFVPNARLGSVLVITSRSDYLDEAQRWIRDLDRTAGRSRPYTEVYPLQNRRAAEVAPVLNNLIGGGGSDAGGGSGVAGEAEGEDLGLLVPTSAAASGGTSGASVAADPERNALIVRGLQADHDEVRHLLVSLDSRARQVALEATIAEVVLNDEVSLGVRWYFEDHGIAGTLSDAAGGAVTPNFPGFSSVFSLGGDAQFVINALAGATDVRIISAPTLMVLDNREAVLQIGDQVPVATQTSTSSTDADAPTITSISYRDTGVILEVRPQIGAGGSLTLDISQEVSSVAANTTSGIDSPTIRQRQITTSVVLQDGATLALGGLVQEGDTRSESGVPGLREVPFLGAAFRSRDSSKSRTELLILIRPHVIESGFEASDFTAGMRRHLGDADGLLATGLGAPRHSVDEVLR